MTTTPKSNLSAKPLLLAALLLTFSCLVTTERAIAQERGLTLRANYPLTVGDTFLSQYDGIVGFGLIYNQPVFSGVLLRPAIEYERLNTEVPISSDIEVAADAYTAQLGLGYPVKLISNVKLIPEVGVGYTYIGFELHGDDVSEDNDASDDQSGLSTWVAINPRYSFDGAIELGATFGYRAAFLEAPEAAADTPYNRQLHALVFGATLTYSF